MVDNIRQTAAQKTVEQATTKPQGKTIFREEKEGWTERFSKLGAKHRLFPALILARNAQRRLVGLAMDGDFKQWNFKQWMSNEKYKADAAKNEKYTDTAARGVGSTKDKRAEHLLAVFVAPRLVVDNARRNKNKGEIDKNDRFMLQSAAAAALAAEVTGDASYGYDATSRTDASASHHSTFPDAAAAAFSAITDAAYAARLAFSDGDAASRAHSASASFAHSSHADVDVAAIIKDTFIAETTLDIQQLIDQPLWPDGIPAEVEQSYHEEWLPAVQQLITDTADSHLQQALETMLADYEVLAGFDRAQGAPTNRVAPETVREAQDSLNREKLAENLADLLREPSNHGHLTIGLLGHWGTGKTQMVELLKDALQKKSSQYLPPQPFNVFKAWSQPRFLFGEFNAWAYEHSRNIQAGMAHEVVRSLTTFQGDDDLSQQRWFLKPLYLLRNMAWHSLWAIVVRGWLSLSFACRRYPMQCVVFLLLLTLVTVLGSDALREIAVASADANSNGIPSLFSQIPFVGSLIGAVLGFVVMLKQLRGLVSQTFTKELLSYVKLPSYAAHIGQVSQMREDIRLICDIRLGNMYRPSRFSWGRWFPNKRLLFVVDDLDRCDPEGIVKTFEAIRLILDIPHVTVVIAIDQRIALAAMAMHYQELVKHHQLSDAQSIARDYLGKMIQLPIVLDDPDMNAVSVFMADIWGDKTEEERAWKNHISTDHSNEKKENKESTGTTASSESTANDKDDSKVKPLSIEALTRYVHALKPMRPPTMIDGLTAEQKSAFVYWSDVFGLNNPRQLKRLHNSYNLLQKFPPLIDEQQAGDTRLGFGLLVSLLLLEFVNNVDSQALRKAYKVYVFDGKGVDADIVTDRHVVGLLDDALQVVDSTAPKNHPDEEILIARARLLRFVERFVLPVIESGTDVA